MFFFVVVVRLAGTPYRAIMYEDKLLSFLQAAVKITKNSTVLLPTGLQTTDEILLVQATSIVG